MQQTFTDNSPSNERQISVCAFITDQPASAVPSQALI
jgi:hypothetical protein